MNARILFFGATAVMWAAAIISYIRHPENWSQVLMWVGIAVVFTVISIAAGRTPPKA